MEYDPQQFQEKSTKMNTENWLPVKTDSLPIKIDIYIYIYK